MPDTDLTVASVVAERLRNYVADEPFRPSGVPDGLTITISIGVASSLSGDTTEALLKRADDAMYEAKRTGRNKVILWTSDGLRSGERRVGKACVSTCRSRGWPNH